MRVCDGVFHNPKVLLVRVYHCSFPVQLRPLLPIRVPEGDTELNTEIDTDTDAGRDSKSGLGAYHGELFSCHWVSLPV